MYERHALLKLNPQSERSRRHIDHRTLVRDAVQRPDLDAHPFLFVEDSEGTLLGILETEELLRRVAIGDPIERMRWSEMTVESLITARIDTLSKNAPQRSLYCPDSVHELNSMAIASDEGDLAALIVNGELFLEWNAIKEFVHLSHVDSITSLPNRKVFDRRLAEEWERIQRQGNSICIFMIDIDLFKQVNDEFGHTFGDDVLRNVAQSIRGQLRSYDLFVRYGGDEFAAILSNCLPDQIDIPIRRIQDGIAALSAQQEPNLPRISISVGAAVLHSPSAIPDAMALVDHADRCLYEAKRNGRGRAFKVEIVSRDAVLEATPVSEPHRAQSSSDPSAVRS